MPIDSKYLFGDLTINTSSKFSLFLTLGKIAILPGSSIFDIGKKIGAVLAHRPMGWSWWFRRS
jgi:hypothetical protein